MKMISPLVPGSVYIVAGVGEATALILQGNSGTPAQLWLQLLNSALIIGIGIWLVQSYLGFREKTIDTQNLDRASARQYTDALGRAMQDRIDDKHEQNTEKMENIEKKQDEVLWVMRGLGGTGGIQNEIEWNKETRHDLVNALQVIVSYLEMASKIEGMPDFYPPKLPQRRRRRDDAQE